MSTRKTRGWQSWRAPSQAAEDLRSHAESSGLHSELQGCKPKRLKSQTGNREQGSAQGSTGIRDAGTGIPAPSKEGNQPSAPPVTALQARGPRAASFFTFMREARNVNFHMEFLGFYVGK